MTTFREWLSTPQFVSWDSYGRVKVFLDGDTYLYEVPDYIAVEQFPRLMRLARKQPGKAFNLLKALPGLKVVKI